MKWTPEVTLSLIEDYRENPCLWDVRLPSYNDKVKKYAIFLKLAKKYNFKVDEIRAKLSRLHSRFKRDLRLRRNGKSRGRNVKSDWYYYQPLLFLEEIVDLQEKLPKQNGKIQMSDNRLSPSKHRENTSVYSDKILSDNDESEDREQSVECSSPGTSVSESEDEIIANEYEPKIKNTAKKRPAQYDSLTEDNTSDEDTKFSKSLLPHISKIPEHKKLRFRNVLQGLVQQFAYNDFVGNNGHRETSSYSSPGTS